MLPDLADWKPYAEIVILTIAYFFVLSTVRGTRGAAILKGLVFVVVVAFIGAMWATDRLGLERIKQLLQLLLSGSVVALIILFTPELRRALLRISQTRLLSPLFHGPSLKVLDDLVEAVDRLAKARTGALLVLEREGGLGEYIEKGTRLDAALSPELIESLFYPGSPLHDGAIIIQHGRITAAGCILPLTENPSMSRAMGTRHRAAMGVSEETDALVLVVSEETGRVSLCVKGQMKSGLSREDLQRELRDLYTKDEKAAWRWSGTRRIMIGSPDPARGKGTPPASPSPPSPSSTATPSGR